MGKKKKTTVAYDTYRRALAQNEKLRGIISQLKEDAATSNDCDEIIREKQELINRLKLLNIENTRQISQMSKDAGIRVYNPIGMIEKPNIMTIPVRFVLTRGIPFRSGDIIKIKAEITELTQHTDKIILDYKVINISRITNELPGEKNAKPSPSVCCSGASGIPHHKLTGDTKRRA